MRIEFYYTEAQPGKLQWDVTHANFSAVTGERSRAYTEIEGDALELKSGFFLDPSRISRKEFPTVPTTRESILTWMLRSKFFTPIWAMKVLLGNEETLYAACSALSDQFPVNLRSLLANRTHSPVEDYLEDLRANKADERFREITREQSIDIATYQAKNVPRIVDTE